MLAALKCSSRQAGEGGSGADIGCSGSPERALSGRVDRGSRIAHRLVLMLGVLLALASPARAVRPDEMLANPVLEARAQEVGKQLRCLVCRNQSVEDSDAGLAHDLRMLIRKRITAGDSDAQVIAYIHSRYGDYVLLRPPFQTDTLLLWGGPLLILGLGGLGMWRFYRRRRFASPPPPLDAEEQRRLAQLLDQGAGS
jgi:cytochrome c-type biogenesis protein CcmH